jgi:predicted homoserine dehydrogenase-like protein
MGAMGKGLLHQCCLTPGLECVALADLVPERAISCAKMEGFPYKVASSTSEVDDTIRSGSTAICEDANLVAGCAGVEILVEASRCNMKS